MTLAVSVAVVGAGAVGCWYGGMLARAGVAVRLIGRAAHVEAMRRDGLRLTSAAFDEHVAVQAETALSAVAGAGLVLVCVKSTDTEAVAAALAPHVAPGACVLSLQNGVDNAARLQARLAARVAPAVVYVACEMGEAGQVRHLGRGELVIPSDILPTTRRAPIEVPMPNTPHAPRAPHGAGTPYSPDGPDGPDNANQPNKPDTPDTPDTPAGPGSADLVALFGRAGVPVTLSDDVLGALWSKLVINCAYNALSAITGLAYGELVRQAGMRETMRAAVLECHAVAARLGVALAPDLGQAVERIALTMPQQHSSTEQDLRRGRPTEIDHLNGYVVREGERLGVPVDVNRALQALVKAIETRAAGP